jgi:hypothetical protein
MTLADRVSFTCPRRWQYANEAERASLPPGLVVYLACFRCKQKRIEYRAPLAIVIRNLPLDG